MHRMRPVALALCLVTSASALAQARYIPANQRKGYSALDDADIHADIAYLASDQLAGRMSLQPGDDAAILWIAGQFGKAGLDPAAFGANGLPSYLQKFELVEYRPDREKTFISLTRGGKEIVWHAPAAFGAYKHAVDVTAPVVFAGYGITSRGLDYDDYNGIDAKGKIVFVFDHEPQEDNPQSIFNGTGNTIYATTRVKVMNAQAHGAIAVVVVAEPNRKHPTNAERAARIGGSITRSEPLPLQAIADDQVKIPVITVNDDVAKTLLATTTMSGSELQSAIDKDLSPEGRDLPDTMLTLHLVNKSERTATTANIAGLLKGSDPTLSAETVIISAHHDHDGSAPCPEGNGGIDQLGQPTPAGKGCIDIWHGADDNASGTAGVIEIARAFEANKVRPARSILFVVFASEERGLLGSYYMAAHPLRTLATTRAMINFDMIGRDEKPSPQTDGLIEIPPDTTNRLNLIGAPYSPDYDAIVREENQLVNLTLDDRFDRDAVLNVLFRSDQFPFMLHNIPAFWWFTGFHPDYHHTTDTVEKIDVPKMRKILQLAYLSAWRFCESQPPVFVPNPKPARVDTPATTEPGPPGAPPPNVIPVSLKSATEPAPPPAPPAPAEPVTLERTSAPEGPPQPPPAATKVDMPSNTSAAPPPPTAPASAKSVQVSNSGGTTSTPQRKATKVTIAPSTVQPTVINPSGPQGAPQL